jgi:acyl dehydratase
MGISDVIGPLGLRVGQVATRTKTITAGDLRLYAELTGDENPLHFDEAFAGGTRFGRLIAQGGVTAGLLSALVAMDLPGPGSVFMSQTLTYHRPVHIGDTLTARVEVVGLKPDKPVCHLRFAVTNQTTQIVLEAEAWTYTMRPDLEQAVDRG